jgi:hypothetical protein
MLPMQYTGLCGSLKNKWCVTLTCQGGSYTRRNAISSWIAQADRRPRFFVHALWWIQNVPETFRTYYTVHCVVFEQERIKEAKKGEMAFQQVTSSCWSMAPGILGLGCDIKN